MRNQVRPLSALAAVLLLVSCSPQRQSTSPDDLRKWNEATLKQDYERNGRKNSKWDEAAGEALTEYARVRSSYSSEQDEQLEYIGEMAADAVRAGCDDPMVGYLYCRFASKFARLPLPELQNEFRHMAASLEGSGYAPIRKFYADLRASNVLWENHDTNLWSEVHNLRLAAINRLSEALRDKNLPIEEASQSCQFLLESTTSSQYQLTNAYNAISVPLFKNWPRAAVSYLVKGKFYYEWAWKGRGGGYADKVTPERWKLFFSRLAEADKALNRAWRLDPQNDQIPTLMISVVEGRQRDRAEMETWFNRAMNLNTNNYQACLKKLHYLYPQWYGSREDMLEFGRQCVESTRWGGDVPLILVDAHLQCARRLPRSEQAGYWGRSDVWPDIRAAYEKFFQLNPAAEHTRNYYAWYAQACEQWPVFNEQIAALKEVDFAVFGGKEEFDKMTARARAAANPSP